MSFPQPQKDDLQLGAGIRGGKKLAGRRSRRRFHTGSYCRSNRYWHGLRPGGAKNRIRARLRRRCRSRRNPAYMVEFALPHHEVLPARKLRLVYPRIEGTDWLKKSLTRLHEGALSTKTSTIFATRGMLGHCTFCPSADAAAMPTIAFVKSFATEFEDHLEGRGYPLPPVPTSRNRATGLEGFRWLMFHLLSTARSSPHQRARSPLNMPRPGIEIPAFCYYPGLSLRAACCMCVVTSRRCPEAAEPYCTTPRGRRHDHYHGKS